MEPKLSWWQRIKQHSFIATGIIVLLIVLIAFIFAAYRFSWSGTGFLNKTVWDWLQLLIIPVALALIALLFNRATTRTEQKIAADRYKQDKEIASRHYHQDQQIAKQRYEQDQNLALDKQRDDLLQTYLDRMSELLLDKQLRTSEPDAEVRNVARVRTITVLFQLNTARIDGVFSFLREAGLISNKPNNSIVSLSNADFDGINLRGVNLCRTDFSGTTFRRADLSRADLSETNLSGTNFLDANLREANLREANLREALLLNTNLFGAVLEKANLKEALILKANLKEAFLEEADLSGASLSADMSGARDTTPEQLAKAKSLEGAIMPDGSIHP
jgi:uncharacterized protein YjbI with pentapeptide repeats